MGTTFSGDFNQMGIGPGEDVTLGNRVVDILFKYLRSYGYKGSREGLVNGMALNAQGVVNLKLVPIIIDGFGFGLRTGLDSDMTKLDQAMKVLASKSGGKIPAWRAVNNAIGDRAKQFDWLEAIKFTAVGTGKSMLSSVQDVGNTLRTTGRIAQFLIPAIPIVIVLGLFLRAKGGGINSQGLIQKAKARMQTLTSRSNPRKRRKR